MTLWTILRLASAAFCFGVAIHRYRTRQPREAVMFLGFALSIGSPFLPEPWGTILLVVGVATAVVGVIWNRSGKV